MKNIYKYLYSDIPSRDSDDIYNKIVEYLKSHNQLIYLFIDEIHELEEKEMNRLLFTLSRFNEDLSSLDVNSQKIIGNNKKRGQIGFIIISNDSQIMNKIEKNTKSTFRSAEPIVFNKYNAEELYKILEGRVKEGALRKGAITDKDLKLISALSADEGDARYAILLLSLSAKLAEREGLKVIDEKTIEMANNRLRENLLKEILEDLSSLEAEVLKYIYDLYKENKMITTGTIHSRMVVSGSNISLSRVSQIVSNFLKDNIVYKTLTGKRGHSRSIRLDETVDVVEDFLRRKYLI